MFFKSVGLLYLIVISIYDLNNGHIPDKFTLCFFAVSIFFDLFTTPNNIPKHLLVAVFFGGVFFFIKVLTKGIGMGDVKLAAVMGYAFGVFKTSIIFILASTAGITVFIIKKISMRKRKCNFSRI